LKDFKDDDLKTFLTNDFKRMLEQIYCSTHCLYQLDAELKKIKISDVIEIRASEVARTKKQSTFFNDVFRIELCDSMKNHLSIIDVSEIF